MILADYASRVDLQLYEIAKAWLQGQPGTPWYCQSMPPGASGNLDAKECLQDDLQFYDIAKECLQGQPGSACYAKVCLQGRPGTR